ncbi:MAG: tyrosine-type recombinase/integrase [Fibrobacteria bacterium]|nr:tyrosine-type recombinase/integrase [Fibrobacteria bacterium]
MIKKYYITQPFIRKGNNNYYGICYCDGKRMSRKSLGTSSKKVAQDWKRQQEALLYQPTSARLEFSEKVLSEAVNEYKRHIGIQKNDSPRTLQAYMQYIDRFITYLKGQKKLVFVNDLTREHAQKYIDHLTNDLGAKTTWENYKFVRKMFKTWTTYKFIDSNPFVKQDGNDSLALPALDKSEKPFWEEHEIVSILDLAPKEIYPFWFTLAYTGLRFREARDLTFEQIDFKMSEISIMGKGGKPRVVPMCEGLKRLLTKEQKTIKSGNCFPLIPDTEQGCLKILKRVLKGTAFKKLGQNNHHRFRHSFASNLLRKGVNVKAVQQLLGHSSSKITLDIYGHLLSGDLHEAVKYLTPQNQRRKVIPFKATA